MKRTSGLAASLAIIGAALSAACSSGGAFGNQGTGDNASHVDAGLGDTDGGVAGGGDGGSREDKDGSGEADSSGHGGGTDAMSGHPAGDGAASDGIAPNDGAPSNDTGASTESGAFQPPPPQANCAKTGTWGAGVLLDLSTAGDDWLDAVTPDELSVVWTVAQGSIQTIHYADRTATSAAFTSRSLPAGMFTNDRVALSGDGLRLVVVDADGQGFSELARASRAAAFDPSAPATGNYANLNGALGPGKAYGDPVLGANDAVFFYSVYDTGGDAGPPNGSPPSATIFRAARLLSTDVWPDGVALSSSSGLFPQAALRQRPTGLSSDEQTLFVWDEITGTERAAWLDSSGTFSSFEDLGDRSMATASGDCTALYYSAAGATSIDLFVATSH